MRKLFPMLAVAVAFTALGAVWAAEDKTVSGGAVCAKCALKETPTCQNVVMVDEGGKMVNYYLTGDVSKKAHGAMGICTAQKDSPVKIKVTGSCAMKDGKLVMEVTKIEKAE
jgi:hypothetical protein